MEEKICHMRMSQFVYFREIKWRCILRNNALATNIPSALLTIEKLNAFLQERAKEKAHSTTVVMIYTEYLLLQLRCGCVYMYCTAQSSDSMRGAPIRF